MLPLNKWNFKNIVKFITKRDSEELDFVKKFQEYLNQLTLLIFFLLYIHMSVTHDKKNLDLNKFKRALNTKILSNKNYYVSENGNIFSSGWCINNVS